MFSLNATHPTQERLATPPGSTSPTLFDQWCGFFSVRQEQDKWKCCETGPTVFVLSEKTKNSNRLQMSLQRQHFLLIFILSLSYLKTLSVGPARVWTRELPLSRPVEQARRRSQQRSTSCLLQTSNGHLYHDTISATAWVVYTLVCKEASSSFRLKREVCRERMCARRNGGEKGMLATDQTWFLATLNEDRFLFLWEITYCRMCGCFQRFNLEVLSSHIGTENLTVKAEGWVM